jgi:hypothetical protein
MIGAAKQLQAARNNCSRPMQKAVQFARAKGYFKLRGDISYHINLITLAEPDDVCRGAVADHAPLLVCVHAVTRVGHG